MTRSLISGQFDPPSGGETCGIEAGCASEKSLRRRLAPSSGNNNLDFGIEDHVGERVARVENRPICLTKA
jgi:hypothetical protein